MFFSSFSIFSSARLCQFFSPLSGRAGVKWGKCVGFGLFWPKRRKWSIPSRATIQNRQLKIFFFTVKLRDLCFAKVVCWTQLGFRLGVKLGKSTSLVYENRKDVMRVDIKMQYTAESWQSQIEICFIPIINASAPPMFFIASRSPIYWIMVKIVFSPYLIAFKC